MEAEIMQLAPLVTQPIECWFRLLLFVSKPLFTHLCMR